MESCFQANVNLERLASSDVLNPGPPYTLYRNKLTNVSALDAQKRLQEHFSDIRLVEILAGYIPLRMDEIIKPNTISLRDEPVLDIQYHDDSFWLLSKDDLEQVDASAAAS